MHSRVNMKILLRLVCFGLMACASALQSAEVPVGNPSFETVGDPSSPGNTVWYKLANPGDWVDGNITAVYDINVAYAENTHFTAAADGTKQLNLGAAQPLSQDLAHTVAVGDVVTLSFWVGNSKGQTDPPGDVNATIMIDGVDVYTELVDNDASNDGWSEKSVQWVATSSGNLGIKFTQTGNAWLDDISVDVTTPSYGTVAVGNASFETEGTPLGGTWYQLPSPGDWVDGYAVGAYEILDPSGYHFSAAADGDNVMNLGNATPMTQDVGVDVASGDVILLTLAVGNSQQQADPPGDVAVTFTLDGSDAYTETVTNTASDNTWEAKAVAWKATASGTLGLKFVSVGSGIWIDDIGLSMSTEQMVVTFVEGDHGTRTGGGALVQMVDPGGAAVEPVITPDTYYTFAGWSSTAYTNVTSNMTITALYTMTSAPDFADGDFEVITGSADRLSGHTFGAWTVGDPNKRGADGWVSGQTPFNDQVYTRANAGARASDGVDSVTFFGGNRGGGEIYQTFSTTAGETYAVKFDIRLDTGTVPAGQNFYARVFDSLLDTTVSGASSGIDMGGQELGGVTLTALSTVWSTQVFTFTATSGVSSISFLGEGTEGNSKAVDLDNVRIVEAEPPTPDPLTWDTPPAAISAAAITMTATTATDDSGGVEYYFENTTNANNSGWTAGTTWTDSGLSAGETYSYRVKARDVHGNETGWSTPDATATTESSDSDAPTPDPMTWAVPPTSLDATHIVMTATTATDASGGIEYCFTNTTTGVSSGWQSGVVWTNSGLTLGQSYEYRVMARDLFLNETAWSDVATATPVNETDPPTPDPMAFATEPVQVGRDTVVMTATPATDVLSPPVEYYFLNTSNGDNSGWSSARSWTNSGLAVEQNYGFTVKARDALSNETTPSTEATVFVTLGTFDAFSDGDFEVISASADRLSGHTFGTWTVGDPNKHGADNWVNGQTPFNDQIYTRANVSARASDGVDSVTFFGGNRGGGEIYQAFATTSGATYIVRFDVRLDSGTVPVGQSLMARVFDWRINSTQPGFRSSIDMGGQELGGLSLTNLSTTWSTKFFKFTAASGGSTIAFLGVGTEGASKAIDLDSITIGIQPGTLFMFR